MAHTLYVGVTQSGKTTLARMVCRGLSNEGKRTAVFDPMGTETAGGDWGKKTLYFDDVEKFLDWAYSDASNGYHIFIDEAHKIFSHEQREHFWMLTEGRHHHMHLHLMTQRPNKVHPDVRSNCTSAYMFRLKNSDVSEIGADYGHSALDKEILDRGDFLILNSGSSAIGRANVFKLLEK